MCTTWFLVYSQGCVVITIVYFQSSFYSRKNHVSSHSPFPSSLETINLLSVSVDLLVLDSSCKLYHTLRGLLCLASFTQCNVFKVMQVHPCNMYQCFIHSFLWSNSIPYYGYTTFCFFTHQQMDIQTVSSFWLL